MSSISEILHIEQVNSNRIYLHREGLFWKAYQRSAYLFLEHYKVYKVTKKYVKVVKADVVSLGFPTAVLEQIVSSGEINTITDKLIYMDCEDIDDGVYINWFESVPYGVPVVKPNNIDRNCNQAIKCLE